MYLSGNQFLPNVQSVEIIAFIFRDKVRNLIRFIILHTPYMDGIFKGTWWFLGEWYWAKRLRNNR